MEINKLVFQKRTLWLIALLLFSPNILFAKWSEKQILTPSDSNINDLHGHAVALDGQYAIVSSFEYSDEPKAPCIAYIYKYNDQSSTWVQHAILNPPGDSQENSFGCAVSISGNYAIVGAKDDNSIDYSSGAAFVFKCEEDSWTLCQKITALDGEEAARFGSNVAIDGDTAIIGAPGDNDKGTSAGAAYIFKIEGDSWIQKQKLFASNENGGDYFGTNVDICGKNAIVGAYGKETNGTHSGAAYIFHFDGNNWFEQDKLLGSDTDQYDVFGWRVSICENYALVSAQGYNSDSGAAFIFKKNTPTDSWKEVKKVIASDSRRYDYFGRSVATDGVFFVVGSIFSGSCISNGGKLYVYKFVGSELVEWARLCNSQAYSNGLFGHSAAIDNGRILASCPGLDYEDSPPGRVYYFENTPLEADLDGNSFVNLKDFVFLAESWLDNGCTQIQGNCNGCDLDESGQVDINDIGIFSMKWLN
ncbi:MAG: FG-GAP repeat protein [Phycisphaerae bacterium]|nr:FG-GAP repeat protein [Phycisphaerae bacterium]